MGLLLGGADAIGWPFHFPNKEEKAMAIAYIEKLDGYIADTPNLDFLRCDGTAFSYYEVNSANFTDTLNFLTITGGWGTSPLAYVPTDRTTEFEFESSQFTIDMFAMSNAESLGEGDYGIRETDRFDVKQGTGEGAALTVELPFDVQAGSVRIRNMTEATAEEGQTAAASQGKFAVTITDATENTAGKTVITFATGDVKNGDTIRVSYRRRVVGATALDVKTTSSTAKGSLSAHYPVYSSGTDCTDASVKGWLHLEIPRVRVTALPGFSNSYKSAATNSVTFAAIDAKRADKMYYRIMYEPADSNGDIVAKSKITSDNVKWG